MTAAGNTVLPVAARRRGGANAGTDADGLEQFHLVLFSELPVV
jgi:hypothetical protein